MAGDSRPNVEAVHKQFHFFGCKPACLGRAIIAEANFCSTGAKDVLGAFYMEH
jgi:hypothetical protein